MVSISDNKSTKGLGVHRVLGPYMIPRPTHYFGKLVSTNDGNFVFISIWKDFDAIKATFGEDW